MKKVYVLDTNVILTDPVSFESFEDNEVIIPFIVIEELEKHKTRSDEIGRNAREFSRNISKYLEKGFDLKKGFKTEKGNGTVRALSSNDLQYHFKQPLEMDGKPDNVILSLAKDLMANNPKEQVILVTQDLLLQIKANSVGLKVQGYKKNKINVEEDGFYKGFRVITEGIDRETIDYFHECEKNGDPLDFSVGEELYPNEFVLFKDEKSKASAILRYKNKKEGFCLVKESSMHKLTPRNKEQRFALDVLQDPNVKLVTLTGKAGNGKTILAVGAGLEQVLDKKYEKLVVARPMISVGKEMGFLPGSAEEKTMPWMMPIVDNLHFLLGGKKRSRQTEITIDLLMEKGTIELQPISLIRGRSFHNSFIIIDEAQNLTQHELKTIITRAGENTKIVLTGDVDQIDTLSLDAYNNGLSVAIEKFKEYNLAAHVTLLKGERSELASLAADVL